jgi:hypothetical protein
MYHLPWNVTVRCERASFGHCFKTRKRYFDRVVNSINFDIIGIWRRRVVVNLNKLSFRVRLECRVSTDIVIFEQELLALFDIVRVRRGQSVLFFEYLSYRSLKSTRVHGREIPFITTSVIALTNVVGPSARCNVRIELDIAAACTRCKSSVTFPRVRCLFEHSFHVGY